MIKTEPEFIYIIFCDIVKYSTSTSSRMNEVINQFFDVVKKSIDDNLTGLTLYLHSTGDGCLIIAQDATDNDTRISMEGINKVLKCAIEIFTNLRTHSISIRMAISTGSLTPTVDINGKPQFVGHEINDCQRIMDFGEESHLLMSRNMFNNLNKEERDTVTMKVESCAITYNIRIEKAKKQYWDKHGNNQEIYVVDVNEAGNKAPLTKRRPPPLKWKVSKGQALTKARMDFFDSILKSSDKFWSITLESPSEWLLDESLLYVLFKQASISGNDDLNDKFKRFIICDEDQINTPDGAMLRKLHRYANVQLFEITQEKAAKEIDDNEDLIELKKKLKLSNESDKKLVKEPLQEMWISYKDEKPTSAGYGIANPGGSYNVFDAEEGIEQFIHHIFETLDTVNCKRKGDYI